MTADEIAQKFAAQMPVGGGWLSVRQTAWLLDTYKREVKAAGYQADSYDAVGYCKNSAGQDARWELHRTPNHAGSFRLTVVQPAPVNTHELETLRANVATLRAAGAPEFIYEPMLRRIQQLEA